MGVTPSAACCPDGSSCCGTKGKLLAEVAQVNSQHPTFPTRQSKVEIGMCVSGGGTRALCFSLGVYRELWSLGVIDKIDCISSISGGTWASALFMFATEYKSKPIGTDELLGELTDPARLTMDYLNKDPAPLAAGATRSESDVILKMVGRHFLGLCPLDQIQQRIVGDLYLKDFGLESMDAYMVASESDKQRIISTNPQLKAAQFLMPRTDRPRAFVMGGTLFAPFGYEADGNSAVSLQMSPDYTGCPFYPNGSTVTYKRAGVLSCCAGSQMECLVGGGLVETFAFNGSMVTTTEQDDMVEIDAPWPIPMSLCQAYGISSDAVGSTVQLSAILGRYATPSISYQPIPSDQFPSSQPAAWYNAGDGGDLDNSGLLALLQRGAKKVIMVLSSYRGLNPDYDLASASAETFDPDKACVTEDLYDKFGYGYATANLYYSHNQVFAKDELLPIVRQIAALKKSGKPAVVSASLEVVSNSWWGIEGGRSVEVLIIYLEKVTNFEESLPSDTREQLAKGEDGQFSNYPILDTTLAGVAPCKVNLLAAQGEYCIRENSTEFINFVASAQQIRD